jgi:hypothetical protein
MTLSIDIQLNSTECLYAVSRLLKYYAEWRQAECLYAECRYTECHYAECRKGECLYAECRSAD